MTITLKIADKELKCSLGLMFLGEFLDVVDMTLEEVGEKMGKNPFKLLPKMVYTSAKVEAELNDEDFGMTLKELVELIEKDGGIASPAMTLFVNAWTKSMLAGVPEEESAEEGGEKAKK
jgi:hypothetical protein